MCACFLGTVQGFLAPFPVDVKSVCPSLVSSTIDVYQRVLGKFHYTFNQRDVIRVLQVCPRC